MTTLTAEYAPNTFRAMCSDIAAAQERGELAAVVDRTGDIDLRALREAGVDCTRLLVSQPDDSRRAADVLKALHDSGQIALVVVYEPTPACCYYCGADRHSIEQADDEHGPAAERLCCVDTLVD